MNCKTIKEYHAKHATVYLLQSGDKYIVRMRTSANQVRDMGSLKDEVMANEYFDLVRNHAMGHRPAYAPDNKCTHDKDNVKTCCAANCPHRTNGPAFWELFRTICAYRTK